MRTERRFVRSDESNARTRADSPASSPSIRHLREEQLAGLGQGAARDPAGKQWVMAGTVMAYGIAGDEDGIHAERAAAAIDASQNVRNAFWLNGRPNRTATDFYMIHKYAKRDFGGEKGMAAALGISASQQRTLRQSANNLSPLDGGRHVHEQKDDPWTLEDLQEFTADLLRRWIACLSAR
jgi:hypothetical protein